MGNGRTANWSYTADQRFELPVTVIKTCNTIPTCSNQFCRIPAEAPRSSRPITKPMSSSSYVLPLWQTSDREVKRKKRVAAYKAYAVEGKVKASLRNSFRWVKNKYSAIVHGC
ncbi:uncharacterized protein LOC130760599 [Actinidia eriantha]|uniref:uncharacterized protein LOC130760599 n=1 Tax=Actinidia eriantha TaxID=165200 RepID=UPI00258A93CE|nr:uncharacterized protein LOC130760599 [Actinidia eriantha]